MTVKSRDANTWAQVSARLDELLDLEDGARASRLAELAAADKELADEVAALLARQGAIMREGFLEGTAAGVPHRQSVLTRFSARWVQAA